MPQIIVETQINADIKTCFDLARDIGFYKKSLKKATEIPISGKIHGLVEKDDIITWEINYLWLCRHITIKISECSPHVLFVDEMVKGDFKSYIHKHVFNEDGHKTIMIDDFFFESPYGILGKLVDFLFLKPHIAKLLKGRNKVLKLKAESLNPA